MRTPSRIDSSMRPAWPGLRDWSKYITTGMLMLMLLWLVPTVGCGGGPKLSPRGYKLTLALMNICGREDEAGLAKARGQIELARNQSQLDSAEVGLLLGFVTTAESGDWKRASQGVRELMKRQTSRSPLPGNERQSAEPAGEPAAAGAPPRARG